MSSREQIEIHISQVALGNRQAFSDLYDATSAKLFGICLRILNDRSEAEEALQETYVKVWRSADKFASGKASPISWLAAIARNSAIDRYRKKKPDTAELVEAEVVADEAPSPESNAIMSDDMDNLDRCMGELDERHASAIRNVYLGGWSYNEAATELDIPLNTVKTWIRRGLISLRECLNR
ncbi:MAG: sigma-70 family RNA polymerase sigma factor [Rhizobiaceae bacterium]|jgi:RNA polymerase sigma-70 factor (ECF subfamily)|nr:sigma-70 family RNA polymerase sigma factor [Rhizobiaceae bacterium]